MNKGYGIQTEMDKALLVVPHQDDETNLAGNIMERIKEKYDLYILYSSLDADLERGIVRKQEAIKACAVWSITPDHLIFLDYPDTPNKVGHHYYSDGDHRIVDDLKHWILRLKPSIIFATDFDYHSDHRMLSIAFETAMGQVLKENIEYHPIVLKGFCYETAYYSVEDYKASRPQDSVINMNLLSNPSYEWEKRVSIKSSEKPGVIWHRKAYKALKAHRSQYAIFHARSIVNQDNVFWLRRTDNLLNQAKLTASIEDAEKLRDFKILDTDDLITQDPRKIKYCGCCSLRKGDWIKAEWEIPVKIVGIVINGSIDLDERKKTDIEIYADGEYVERINILMPYGRNTIAYINRENVKKLGFFVLKNSEISEITVFCTEDIGIETDNSTENQQDKKKISIINCIDIIGYKIIVLYTKAKRKLKKIIMRTRDSIY